MLNSENGPYDQTIYRDGDDGWEKMADNGAEIRSKTKEVEEAIAEAEEFIARFDPSSDEDNAKLIRVRGQLEALKDSDFYESVDHTLQIKIDELIEDLE